MKTFYVVWLSSSKVQMRLSGGRVWRPCSKLFTKAPLLFSCPGQMPLFAAFNILLELRVHPITQADYGYRSRLRSIQQHKWRNRWQTWTFCWLTCYWTTVNCNCSYCVLSQWTWTLIARKMELSQRESTAVENMGAPRRALLSSSAMLQAVGLPREDSAFSKCPKAVVPLTQN